MGAVLGRGIYFFKFFKERRNITDYPTKRGVIEEEEIFFIEKNVKFFILDKYEYIIEILSQQSDQFKTFNNKEL
jgi:hypothetical protein